VSVMNLVCTLPPLIRVTNTGTLPFAPLPRMPFLCPPK